MSDLTIKGKVIQCLGMQSGTSKSGKNWSKATVILETPGQYPKTVAVTNMNNAEKFAAIPVGSTGEFCIEIDSREYNGKWYTNVNCWKWTLEQPSPVPQPQPIFPQQAAQPGGPDAEQDDSLPF